MKASALRVVASNSAFPRLVMVDLKNTSTHDLSQIYARSMPAEDY